MSNSGITNFLEIGPGKALTGPIVGYNKFSNEITGPGKALTKGMTKRTAFKN